MASNTTIHNSGSQTKRTSFSSFPGGNASILFEKHGIRGSTPDSEALASSDDDQDHLQPLRPVTSNPGPKPARRASWLGDGQQVLNRKHSLGGSVPFSPVSPSTTGPSNDQLPWGTSVGSSAGSALGRGHSNSTSFAWSNNIWNTDSQKGPPQRLSEVLPSPTSLVPPGSVGLYSDEPLQSPPIGRENATDHGIPFPIPLQPTLKTYRSQSYSVGQIDPETPMPPSNAMAGHAGYPRPRTGTSYGGLPHRTSRASMRGDMALDPSYLGQVREVEDDEESSTGSGSGVRLPADDAQTRAIENLTRENAILRQAAADMQSSRNQYRGLPSNSAVQRPQSSGQYYHQRLQESVPEELNSALLDADDLEGQFPSQSEGQNARRFSEYATSASTQYPFAGIPENRTLENVKKGHWQSSLGFAGVGEPPQSRRHSFADIPTRQNSIGSATEAPAALNLADIGLRARERRDSPGGYGDGSVRPSQGDSSEYKRFSSRKTSQEIALEDEHLHDRGCAVAYFSRPDHSSRNGEDHGPLSTSGAHQVYMSPQYNRPQQLGHPQHRQNQLLYIVTFKCQRADVFYVQEGTGLQIRKGDLVIVEADRGTDLGTVATEDIPWAEAKEMKERFMHDHHKWLMVFSHHTQNGNVAGPNPNGQPHPHSAGGATGSSAGHANLHDLPSGELKPKMIKRLAQAHEIQNLREKEGAEAKAKRICQAKVVEHRLNMEILDAEFQMDWKKLTFFYFADSYINFNPLVTDLFKIYKTRIWMSAINTAAIGSHAGAQHLIGGLGHSGSKAEYEDHSSHRQQHNYGHPASTTTSQPTTAAFESAWDPSRDIGPGGGVPFPQLYTHQFQGQGFDVRQMQYPMEYRQVGQQAINMSSPFGGPAGYNSHGLHHTSSFTSQPDNGLSGAQDRQGVGGEWSQAFNGLSLGQ